MSIYNDQKNSVFGHFLRNARKIQRERPTTQNMKFSIKDFFSKYDQICRKLRIWSYLLKKSLMKNFICCLEDYERSTLKVFSNNIFQCSIVIRITTEHIRHTLNYFEHTIHLKDVLSKSFISFSKYQGKLQQIDLIDLKKRCMTKFRFFHVVGSQLSKTGSKFLKHIHFIQSIHR